MKVPYDLLTMSDNLTTKAYSLECTTCKHTRSIHIFTCVVEAIKYTNVDEHRKPNECMMDKCDCKLFSLITFETEIERMCNT